MWLGKGNDPRYTPSTTFETFPFPAGLTPEVPAADYEGDPRAVEVAAASRRLVDLRDRWLNPPEWVEWVDEPAPGYPRRPVPRDEEEEATKALRKRTLTNLYNARPQWLVDAHAALVNMNDSPARTDPEEAEIGRPTETARRLVEASVSPNTRRAYAGALRRLDAWLDGRELDDVALAAYLAELHDAGRASSSATMAVAAACFRAKLVGQPTPAGERTARVLAGYRRTAGDRGRGQARPFGAADLAAVLATCHRPRRRGRGVESDQVAHERGRLDAVVAGLLFMAGMRRSEVSALRWADVVDTTDGDGMLVTVRRSKTNPEGDVNDVRFVKGGVARALCTLRASTSPEPGDRVMPLSPQMIGLRFTAAGAGCWRREPGHRAFGARRVGVGADEPGRVDHRRDARRQLENQPHGGALLCRRNRGTRCGRTIPVDDLRP